MSIGNLSQIKYLIGKGRPYGTFQAHNNVILCCRTVGNTFWREAKYDAWFNPMVIKLLKKSGEVKLEISINALLLKINKGNIGNAANYSKIGGLWIICKVNGSITRTNR